MAFGVWLRCTLAESPATAKFLEPRERQWLATRIKAHKARALAYARRAEYP